MKDKIEFKQFLGNVLGFDYKNTTFEFIDHELTYYSYKGLCLNPRFHGGNLRKIGYLKNGLYVLISSIPDNVLGIAISDWNTIDLSVLKSIGEVYHIPYKNGTSKEKYVEKLEEFFSEGQQ
jgi:hypothetical protein